MDADPLIRPIAAADIPALALIHAESFGAEAWDAASLATLALGPGGLGLAAAAVNLDAAAGPPFPIGFLLIRVVLDEAEILTLAVRPTARRSGVAERLLIDGCQRLRAYGVRVLHLEVAEDNEAARALYLKVGFRDVGCRSGYYRRPDGGTVAARLCRLDLAGTDPSAAV